MIDPKTAIARLDPQALLTLAVENKASIDTLERLVALAKDMRAMQAREAWHTNMADFQKECPPIKKTAKAKIASNRGSYSYSYAPLDEILPIVMPGLGQRGFTVSWRAKCTANQVVVSCHVAHIFGHVEDSGEVVMPIMDDGRGASAPQRVAISLTYAKRYALLGILGLAPEDDDDGGTGREPERIVDKETGEVGRSREDILDEIKQLSSALRLETKEKAELWERYCGVLKPATVALSNLITLETHLRGRLKNEVNDSDHGP